METPEFFDTTYYNNANAAAAQFNNNNTTHDQQKPKNNVNTDHFIIDDLLDFPNDDAMDPNPAAPFDPSTTDVTTVSDFHPAAAIGGGPGDAQFASELCVPYDDMAELEWLSNFVDESFSSEDLQKLHLIQGMKQARTHDEPAQHHQYQFQPEPETARQPGPLLPTEMSVPAKARSKRSRAAPGNWTSRLLVVSPQPIAVVPAVSSSSESDGKKAAAAENSGGGEGRRCLHCATDKTPQWRTGPMGPKTLCNACGVRYKSGRLVPEYRPAASPTFVLTKHSNSHRKVLELRRQKEMQRAQQHHQQQFMQHHHHHHQNMHLFDVSSNGGDDYLIHQHIGPDYRQMI